MKNQIGALALSMMAASGTANAQITVNNVFFDDTVLPTPASTPFDVNFRLFGSQFNRPNGFVEFFLTEDGGATGFAIGTEAPNISCGSTGCTAISIQNRHSVTRFNTPGTNLDAIEDRCQAAQFQVFARFNGSESLSFNSALLGSAGQPDWLFASGNLAPTVIPPNGSVNVDYGIRNGGCTTPSVLPDVGIFLTDINLTPLISFGNIRTLGQLGSDHQFSLSFNGIAIPDGDYLIALVADINGVSAETDENNNIGTFNFSVQTTQLNPTQQSFTLGAFKNRNVRSFIDPTPDNAELAPSMFQNALPVTKGLSVTAPNDTQAINNKPATQLRPEQ